MDTFLSKMAYLRVGVGRLRGGVSQGETSRRRWKLLLPDVLIDLVNSVL